MRPQFREFGHHYVYNCSRTYRKYDAAGRSEGIGAYVPGTPTLQLDPATAEVVRLCNKE